MAGQRNPVATPDELPACHQPVDHRHQGGIVHVERSRSAVARRRTRGAPHRSQQGVDPDIGLHRLTLVEALQGMHQATLGDPPLPGVDRS